MNCLCLFFCLLVVIVCLPYLFGGCFLLLAVFFIFGICLFSTSFFMKCFLRKYMLIPFVVTVAIVVVDATLDMVIVVELLLFVSG